MPPHPSTFADAWILTGPTGSGNSGLALAFAERVNAEIIALDSMTLYRGMDVGTAKPSRADQVRVRHHLIDVLDPWESANVAWWLDRAAEACQDICSRGKKPLFVGGTPFYLKALLCGLFDSPPVDPAIRARLEAEAEEIGKVALHEKLHRVDAKSATRLHPNDVRRVVRALEVFELTGQPISSFQQSWDNPSFADPSKPPPAPAKIPCIVLEWPREMLYHRINIRVEAMMQAGWLAEVEQLLQASQPISKEAAQALGYRELAAVLRGELSHEDALETIQLRTRQFAKRQLTWFRSLPNCHVCPVDPSEFSFQLTEQLLATFSTHDSDKNQSLV